MRRAILPAVVAALSPAMLQAAGAPVILISIDTLRADHLSSYGYRKLLTPHIDAFVARRAACRNRSHRHTARKGHATIDARLAARARINVSSDPPSAKPAPGPIYAIGR